MGLAWLPTERLIVRNGLVYVQARLSVHSPLEIILGIILVTGIGLGLVRGNMSRKDWVR